MYVHFLDFRTKLQNYSFYRWRIGEADFKKEFLWINKLLTQKGGNNFWARWVRKFNYLLEY